MLFRRKKKGETSKSEDHQDRGAGLIGGGLNPFLKPGDIIRLRSRAGKYQVLFTDQDGFTVRTFPVRRRHQDSIRCGWADFKHWSR